MFLRAALPRSSTAIALALATLAALLGPGAVPAAGEDPPVAPAPAPAPPQPQTAADEVEEALAAADDARLTSLAVRLDPDPWRVADLLLERGKVEAARRFAGATPAPVRSPLGTYLEAAAGDPEGPALRRRLASLVQALQQGRLEDALLAWPEEPPPGPLVPRLRGTYGRAQALRDLGHHEEALAAYQRVAQAAESAGWIRRAADAWQEFGLLASQRGEYARALPALNAWVRLAQAGGDLGSEAAALSNLGVAQFELGDFRQALASHRRSYDLEVQRGSAHGAMQSLGEIGATLNRLGEFRQALDTLELALAEARRLGDAQSEAYSLDSLGSAQRAMGAYDAALGSYRASQAIAARIGDARHHAVAAANAGSVLYALGRLEEALAASTETRAAFEALGDPSRLAGWFSNHALILCDLGRREEALSVYAEGRALALRLKDQAALATMAYGMGRAEFELAHLERAAALGSEALEQAEASAERSLIVRCLMLLADVALAQDADAEALRFAERAAEELSTLVRALDVEHQVSARSVLSTAYERGAQAAYNLGDPARVLHFLEAGRAGALLEALGGPSRLPPAALPEALRREEAQARRAEAEALSRYRAARDAGVFEDVKPARQAYDDARRALLAVLERVDRVLTPADLKRVEPATLAELRSALRSDEALVLYALGTQGSLAYVLTPTGPRLVDLAGRSTLAAAVEAALPAGPPHVVQSALGDLARLLVKPLSLGPGVRRVLISPEDELAYVPFAALLPEREVVNVPSGTTYRLLGADGARRGVGVLALGDPDPEARPVPGAPSVALRGRRLGRLLGGRDEARGVGDLVLLDREATEAGFWAALRTRPRWRSVHFACHGLLEDEQPGLSSLVLTAAQDDDGYLTAWDVLGMKVPADLVVLSACDTARGRVVRGEGLLGLARAFMHAGAPRVIGALWPVDDAATRALMTRFYALWNPRDGAAPLSTAAALRAAQEHVRTFEQEIPDEEASRREGKPVTRRVRPWADPAFWAAWVLWGRAE